MNTRLAPLPAALALSAFPLLAQYKVEAIPSSPPDLPSAYAAVVQKQGYRVNGPSGAWIEVWPRTTLPAGPKSTEEAVAFPTIPQGALLAVVRFPAAGADRRGQPIKPGVYTLRYSMYPVNGDHQGVAPQRDFGLLTPIADDKDPAATPAFEPLVGMSRKASGTPHPAVLSIETPPGGAAFPSVNQEGEKDWSLSFKIGDTPMAVIVVGKSEA